MQFIDEAKIFLKSGKGGDGCVSFRREAHTPRGGPDGGNGGKGGSVILRSVAGLNTLIDFRYQQHFKARAGNGGMGKNRDGSKAEDIYIDLPVGTQILDEYSDDILYDLEEVGTEILVLKGGDGGLGNANFKSSTNQAPRKATKGWEGDEMWIWLKLKLLSDVGLLGLPNAGKSTFLSQVSRARPKIADYPFTTLKPQLGVAYIDGKEFVIADIPGLIAGAAEGRGLGHRFLKHVERCRVNLHIIDILDENYLENYKTIRNELANYDNALIGKPEVIALNKCDAIDAETLAERKKELEEFTKQPVITMSAVTGQGKEEILRALYQKVEKVDDVEDIECIAQ